MRKWRLSKTGKKILFLFSFFLLVGFLLCFNAFSDNNSNSIYKRQKLNSISAALVQKNEFKTLVDDIFIPKVSRVSLVMVGDALIHSAVYGDAEVDGRYDFTGMLSEIKPIISSYDLAFYNQETILGGTQLGLSSYPRFNSPYEVGDAFLDAGFNLVGLANNHTMDRGEQAVLNSVSYWNSKGIMFHGSASSFKERNKPKIMEKNGIKYALLSYTDHTNGLTAPIGKEYLVNVYNEEQVKKDVEALKGKTDIILVSLHFGDEYSHSVSNRQKKIATYLSGLGVDIVIGHHAHVVQPTEMIGNTLVIYSLGNIISAQRGVEKLTGLIYSVDIVKEELEHETRIYLENQKATLTYTYSEYRNGYRHNFKVYPYKQLTEKLLSNSEMYYNRYMGIVISGRQDVEKW